MIKIVQLNLLDYRAEIQQEKLKRFKILMGAAAAVGVCGVGGEVLVGEAVVLYLHGVPLLLFFRRSGLMEKLLRGTPHARG